MSTGFSFYTGILINIFNSVPAVCDKNWDINMNPMYKLNITLSKKFLQLKNQLGTSKDDVLLYMAILHIL